MFANAFFPNRYFPGEYFPKVGADQPPSAAASYLRRSQRVTPGDVRSLNQLLEQLFPRAKEIQPPEEETQEPAPDGQVEMYKTRPVYALQAITYQPVIADGIRAYVQSAHLRRIADLHSKLDILEAKAYIRQLHRELLADALRAEIAAAEAEEEERLLDIISWML